MSDQFDERSYEDLAEKNKAIAAREKRRRDREVADFRKVLSMAEGRRFVWNLLGRLQTFDSVLNMNALTMASNAALSDLGKKIVREIPTQTFYQMQREKQSDDKSEGVETTR